jgi:hypothetical protein
MRDVDEMFDYVQLGMEMNKIPENNCLEARC